MEDNDAAFRGTLKAITIIKDKHGAKPHFERDMKDNLEGASGVIDCPVCEAPLSYSIAPGNNHIWGKCSTEGCLSWMM